MYPLTVLPPIGCNPFTSPLEESGDSPNVSEFQKSDHQVITRHRSTPTAYLEDSAIHILELFWSSRREFHQWLDGTPFQSFIELAIHVLPKDILEEHILPASIMPTLNNLPTIYEHQHQQHQQLQVSTQPNPLPILLNQEQYRTLWDTSNSVNSQFLITGGAGTGKSTLLRELVFTLRSDL
ncbi:hypothetical protein BGZ76_000258, partial [Entomortierella beljakovae]